VFAWARAATTAPPGVAIYPQAEKGGNGAAIQAAQLSGGPPKKAAH